MDEDSLRDLFHSMEPLSFRSMFGGQAIYCNGVIFAVILDGDLMLKGDDQCSAAYEDAGCNRWTYTHAKSGKLVSMPYWTAPETAIDDPDDMRHWAQMAYEAGLRAKKPKKKRSVSAKS